MPSATLPTWQRPAKTTHELPWAQVQTIDLSEFDRPGGKQRLAEDLRKAVHEIGFFSLINTGFSTDEIQRQYDLGQAFFLLAPEDKEDPKYSVDFSQGNYFGYRAPHKSRLRDTNVLHNVESINFAKFIPENNDEPFHPFFEPYKDEIEAFSRKALAVASKVFTLFSIILELPEDYFASRHAYSVPSDDHLRYMTYHPRSKEHDALVQNTWSRAHTDFGSLTLLWNQQVAGLQIKLASGEWRYVPPVDGDGIVCNVGDAMYFWSGGYFKSTTHRVVRPPEDQAHLFRQGLFYFVRPGDEVDIQPAPSPLLKRLGLFEDKGDEQRRPVTGKEYVRARVKDYLDHTNYLERKGQTFKVGNLEIEDEAA